MTVWIYLYGEPTSTVTDVLGDPQSVEDVNESGCDFTSILSYLFGSQDEAENFMTTIPAGVDFDYA